ncbi:MAG: bifunctional 4-hydroxy-2-oxoglutarate aldolase/2-dehydro-3-deoxy-phosphogluconate aldolase [Actinobacteria bacterium]|nr:bifunctional 4-hydroxy-2-oxoglutarate aldolase/2-dehydro-3-deoxy-phosphogluconate aldolase [Actinomycetota bacterium]
MLLRTVAILRGFDPERSRELALRCWGIGVDLVEVPVQGEAGWASLTAVAEVADGQSFGAGTVLTAEDSRRATGIGATVIISPGIDAKVVEAARAAGAIPLPGVMTPTDVTLAHSLGLSVCKLFPASQVGPQWLTHIRGPFPAMRFVAVGGVDDLNAADYLRAGAAGVGFGSSIERVLAAPDPAGIIAELHALST